MTGHCPRCLLSEEDCTIPWIRHLIWQCRSGLSEISMLQPNLGNVVSYEFGSTSKLEDKCRITDGEALMFAAGEVQFSCVILGTQETFK